MLDTILTWQFWLILATICVFIELLTNTFALFAMAGGCLVAMILDLIGMGYVAELVGFSVGTVATFVCLKPFVKRHLESKKNGSYQSNIEALIGREATVTQDSNGEGMATTGKPTPPTMADSQSATVSGWWHTTRLCLLWRECEL